MDRHEAYRLLARVLEEHRALPFAELKSRVGKPTSTRVAGASSAEYLVDVSVSRVPERPATLRVSATVDAANTFRLERVEDEVEVSESDS